MDMNQRAYNDQQRVQQLRAERDDARRIACEYRAAIHTAAAELVDRDDLGPGEQALVDLATCLLHDRD